MIVLIIAYSILATGGLLIAADVHGLWRAPAGRHVPGHVHEDVDESRPFRAGGRY